MKNLSKKEILIGGAILLIIFGVIAYYIYTVSMEDNYEEVETANANENIEETETQKEEETQTIVIHITGEVNNPGIVKIKEGARIADIIDAAGGLTNNANIQNVNLAYVVEDGQKIKIPKTELEQEYITEEAGINVLQEGNQKNDKVDLNRATKDELTTLPGIGESTAQKIVSYRDENGKFNTIEDIKNVPGIGEVKFETLKEYITVK